MSSSPHLQVVFVYKFLFVTLSFCSATHRISQPVPFKLSDFLEATFTVIRPLVEVGSNKCEALKSILGLTYDQMQEQNISDIFNMLTIDVITENGNQKYNLSATKRLSRRLRNTTRVVILIHGFLESSDGLMVQGVAPALLKQPGLKVLALDGRKAINLEYFRSSTYARFMGERLGKFISGLIKNGQDPKNIMMVGHSLGAHIAGIAGKTVFKMTGQQIGRISALDPAGPCFTKFDHVSRLDRNDAIFVDVIHTNAGVLGYNDAVGHKDFYPNGGLRQPGCLLSTCDHSRAWEYYAESVSAENNFPAKKCNSWNEFKDGSCTESRASYMGWNADPSESGVYYLVTNPNPPYGLGLTGI